MTRLFRVVITANPHVPGKEILKLQVSEIHDSWYEFSEIKMDSRMNTMSNFRMTHPVMRSWQESDITPIEMVTKLEQALEYSGGLHTLDYEGMKSKIPKGEICE